MAARPTVAWWHIGSRGNMAEARIHLNFPKWPIATTMTGRFCPWAWRDDFGGPSNWTTVLNPRGHGPVLGQRKGKIFSRWREFSRASARISSADFSWPKHIVNVRSATRR